MKNKVGFGCDSHRLIKLDHENYIPINGVKINCPYSVDAHSDGDVGLHALVDAILGVCGLGDIGEHFPNSSPEWKDCDSSVFLKKALYFLEQKKGILVNIDMVIISQFIRISKYKPIMVAKLSELTKIPTEDINVKAKTAESMGALGRGEGLASYVVINTSFAQ